MNPQPLPDTIKQRQDAERANFAFVGRLLDYGLRYDPALVNAILRPERGR